MGREGHAVDRAATEFRPKLHNQANSLSLESLDVSRIVGRHILDLPKIGRETLVMGRKILDMPKKWPRKTGHRIGPWVAKIMLWIAPQPDLDPNYIIKPIV